MLSVHLCMHNKPIFKCNEQGVLKFFQVPEGFGYSLQKVHPNLKINNTFHLFQILNLSYEINLLYVHFFMPWKFLFLVCLPCFLFHWPLQFFMCFCVLFMGQMNKGLNRGRNSTVLLFIYCDIVLGTNFLQYFMGYGQAQIFSLKKMWKNELIVCFEAIF